MRLAAKSICSMLSQLGQLACSWGSLQHAAARVLSLAYIIMLKLQQVTLHKRKGVRSLGALHKRKGVRSLGALHAALSVA